MEFFREEKVVLFRVVYYGPGLCGKTTNLNQIFSRLMPEEKLSQEILEIPTQTDKTLMFECLPMAAGTISGNTVKVMLNTVPGQVHYQASRKLILKGADGVVFVADSQRSMQEQNQISLSEMKIYMKSLNLEKKPIVLQYNKQDLPDAMDVEEMDRDLQGEVESPSFAASAISGTGVMETMNTILKMAKSEAKKNR